MYSIITVHNSTLTFITKHVCQNPCLSGRNGHYFGNLSQDDWNECEASEWHDTLFDEEIGHLYILRQKIDVSEEWTKYNSFNISDISTEKKEKKKKF